MLLTKKVLHFISDSNGTRTQNYLLRKRRLNHSAKENKRNTREFRIRTSR